MESAADAEYRLRLARGFLLEAEEDFQTSRWRFWQNISSAG